jgi:hypothetical protein
LARLIRERPVLVNLPSSAIGNEFSGQNRMGIMGFRQPLGTRCAAPAAAGHLAAALIL